MRKRIYEIISASNDNDKLKSVYDIFMITVIIVSIIPLLFKQSLTAFDIIDKVCVSIFIIDYLLRWITADYKYSKSSVVSFLRYPFSLIAIIDLISILPSITVLHQGFKLFRLLWMFRALRVFRTFKLLRYSKNARIIANIFKRQKGPLSYVLILAISYIIISALVVFNVEPDSFDSFFDAIYWATVSLTTVGYGDIYPVTQIGRVVTMISSLFGVAIVALPAGIITAGYMDELNNVTKVKKEEFDIQD